MAYNRTISLTVSSGGQTIDLSNLDIEFTIRQGTQQAPNLAEIRIYNVARSTAMAIPETGGMVSLSAGYSDETTGVIFMGEVAQRRIGRSTPIQSFVDIFGKEGDEAYDYAYVSKTMAKGSTPKDHVQAAADAMAQHNVQTGFLTSLLSTPTYPRAVSHLSMARDVLRGAAKQVGADWFITGQTLNVLGKNETLPGSTFVVNETTGMVGVPIETPNGILVRTLLDSRMVVGSQLQINEASIQRAQLDQTTAGQANNDFIKGQGTADGTYKVLYIERQGHLRGQPWYNNITCIGISGTITPGLAGTLAGPAAALGSPAGAQTTPGTGALPGG